MNNLNLIKKTLAMLAIWIMAFSLSAQKLALTGTIFSNANRAISEAEILIFNATDHTFLDRCFTNSLGKFTSARILDIGQGISVEVLAAGFSTYKRDYTVKTGNTGKITLNPSSPKHENGSGGSTQKGVTPSTKGFTIMGTVRSDEPLLLEGVNVSFYREGQESELIDTRKTDENGIYKSAPMFKKGDRIMIVLKKNNYSEVRRMVPFKENKDIREDFVLTVRTFISGFVIQSNGFPLENVQISYQSKQGPWMDVIKTNSKGYFDFDVPAPFKPGEFINIRTDKEKYKPESKKHLIALAENQVNFVLKLWTEEYTPVNFEILDNKGRRVKNGEISYYDDVDSFKTIKHHMYETNPYLLKIKTEPDKEVKFTISKRGFKDQSHTHRFIKGKIDDIRIDLEKDRSNCPCWLYAGIGLAVVSGTSYGLYSGTYSNYEDLKNLDRENDYQKATTELRIGTVAGGLAIGAFTGWLICKDRENKKNEAAEKKRKRMGFAPWLPSDDTQSVQIGLAFKF